MPEKLLSRTPRHAFSLGYLALTPKICRLIKLRRQDAETRRIQALPSSQAPISPQASDEESHWHVATADIESHVYVTNELRC